MSPIFVCYRYYRCTWDYVYDKYKIKQFRCPANYEYTEALGCMPSDTCKTDEKPFECTAEGTFPVAGNCQNYWVCTSNGSGFIQNQESCRSKYLYDRDLKKCRREKLVTNCPDL